MKSGWVQSAAVFGATLALSVAPLTALRAQGHTAVAAFTMERCVNMGNALDTPSGFDWGGRYYTQADYTRIAEAGFDTVRIPVRWSGYTGPEPRYRIHPDFLELVDQNIEWALSSGLNIILNVHHFEDMMTWPASQMARFQAIWRQLSERYAKLPESVWFELLNEPHDQLNVYGLHDVQAIGLAEVRRHNPNRVVILGGDNWSGIGTLDSNLRPDDTNVVYTFHYYDPFDFTHQHAEWLGDAMPDGTRTWGSAADKAELADAVAVASAYRADTGQPVFLGEFGVHEAVDSADRVHWAGAVKSAMEAADLPWCLWAYGNTFPLYSDEKGWDRPMLEALTSE